MDVSPLNDLSLRPDGTPGKPQREPSVPELGAFAISAMTQTLGEETAREILRCLAAIVADNNLPAFNSRIVALKEKNVRLLVLAAHTRAEPLTADEIRDLVLEGEKNAEVRRG